MENREKKSDCGACLGILVMCSHFSKIVCPLCGRVHTIAAATGKIKKTEAQNKNKEINNNDDECHLGHA